MRSARGVAEDRPAEPKVIGPFTLSMRMVIVIDPHEPSWTAAVVDVSLQPVATMQVPVSHDGYPALRRFANR